MSSGYNRAKYTLPYEATGLWYFLPPKNYEIDETLYEKLPEWLYNFKVNLETIGFDLTLDELPSIHSKSALVIDQSMASRTFFEYIHHIKDFEGTIIVCDRALAKVLEYTVPDYVVQVDSSPLCWGFFDQPIVKKHMDEITAIFATTTNPLTIRRWSGKRVFFTPFFSYKPLLYTLMRKSKTVCMQTGGNVATTSWLLALNLGAKDIGMFGIINGYENLEETEYPGVTHKKIKGPYGWVYQDPIYEIYAKIHLRLIGIANIVYGVKTYNCSKSGCMYSEYITDLSLKEFVERFS